MLEMTHRLIDKGRVCPYRDPSHRLGGMSGKIFAPLVSTALTGDPSNPANNYADISSSEAPGNKRVLDVDSPSANIKTDGTSTASTTYVGIAAPGTATSAATWQIFKVVISSGNCTLTYADGNDSFDNIWDNRTGLSYS